MLVSPAVKASLLQRILGVQHPLNELDTRQ